MQPPELSQSLKSAAKQIGFDLCGICPAIGPSGLDRFHQWLDAGFSGEMRYLDDRRDAYAHPSSILDGVRSIVMLGLNYRTIDAADVTAGQGRVSRYAWGSGDYHDLIHGYLKQLKSRFLALTPQANVRGVVDSAPLLEREFAQLAGIGWQGKNTLLLNKQIGSWFFLAALLMDVELAYDTPNQTDHCGTCRACLEACPTNAFVAPNLLDATRCISYLTIELPTPIPVALRRGVADWLFGCDVCQDVCPWNSKAPVSDVDEFAPLKQNNPIDLLQLFDLDDEDFRKRFRKTPLWRSKRRGILRNAAIVLGNQKKASAISALSKGLNDHEPLIRGASAWALLQIGGILAKTLVAQRRMIESDADVLAEMG